MRRTAAATLASLDAYPPLCSLIIHAACESSRHALRLSAAPEPLGQLWKAVDWISGRSSPPIELVVHLFSVPVARLRCRWAYDAPPSDCGRVTPCSGEPSRKQNESSW